MVFSSTTAPAAIMEPSPITAPVHNNGPHANQAAVFNGTAMDAALVANGHTVAHC